MKRLEVSKVGVFFIHTLIVYQKGKKVGKKRIKRKKDTQEFPLCPHASRALPNQPTCLSPLTFNQAYSENAEADPRPHAVDDICILFVPFCCDQGSSPPPPFLENSGCPPHLMILFLLLCLPRGTFCHLWYDL